MTLLHTIWNPSTGINLGFLTIHYYSLMFVIAFSIGYQIMKRIFIKEHENLEKLEPLFMYAVLATLIGARLGHVIFYDWDYYSKNILEIFLPVRFEPNFEFTGFQGLASHGASISFLIAMYFYAKKIIKKSAFWVLDRVAVAGVLGTAFVRLGNFFNSEIIGHKTDAITGIKFVQAEISKYQVTRITNISTPEKAYKELLNNPKYHAFVEQIASRHPAQLYEAMGYICVALVMYFLYWKTKQAEKPGFIIGTYLVLTFTVRFLVEFVKKSQGGFEDQLGELLSTGQWLSLPFIISGAYLMLTASKRTI